MFTGCGTALVTPFRSDLSLDEEAFTGLVRRQVESGIHFLVPCGTTGENPTLDKQERLRVVEITLEEAKGKVPILAGAGGYNTSEVVELARELEAMEVDGLLSVTPYYNKPTPEGLYEHYKAIAAATRLPIVLYNVPSRTGTNITPSTLARLASIDNIVGVKEASGDIGQMAAVFQQVPKTFSVLSGDDSVTLPLMALGGVGVISVVSNEIPAEMSALCDACLKGDFATAREIHRPLPRPNGNKFRREQSRSGQGGPVDDGADPALLPAADGTAPVRQPGEDFRRLGGAGTGRAAGGFGRLNTLF